MKRLLLFLSMLLLVGGTTMAFANGANGSSLTRVSNNENGASTTDVVQSQNNNVDIKPLEATNNEPVITFTTSKKIGEEIILDYESYNSSQRRDVKIEGATLENAEGRRYILTAQTVKIIGNCTKFRCPNNGITSIDLSNNSYLTALNCSYNQLTSLDLSNNSQLTTLYCESNKLTTLDLSKNSKIRAIYCSDNQLTSLVLPQNSPMTSLNCEWNKLTELDLSTQTKLETLKCNHNALTSLDLTNSEIIESIECKENKITQIQLPEDADKLKIIRCHSNNIDVEHMEQLINSLPERIGYRYKDLYYIFDVQYFSSDGNQITREQEQKAWNKGWIVSVSKYTTPTGISTIDNADASPRKVFDLNGCEVNENQVKGVVIVKQGNKTYKKVVK